LAEPASSGCARSGYSREDVKKRLDEDKLLFGMDLSGLDLSGLYFGSTAVEYRLWHNANFAAANLDGTWFSGTPDEKLDFEGWPLAEAFKDASFFDARIPMNLFRALSHEQRLQPRAVFVNPAGHIRRRRAGSPQLKQTPCLPPPSPFIVADSGARARYASLDPK
jgi:hypothetical protein